MTQVNLRYEEVTPAQELTWMSAVGFDLLNIMNRKGWLVLIDPVELPCSHQCRFYGINPEHILVVRSSASCSATDIINSFNRCRTAAAILCWNSLGRINGSATPVVDMSHLATTGLISLINQPVKAVSISTH